MTRLTRKIVVDLDYDLSHTLENCRRHQIVRGKVNMTKNYHNTFRDFKDETENAISQA